jgi:hypothetical protein
MHVGGSSSVYADFFHHARNEHPEATVLISLSGGLFGDASGPFTRQRLDWLDGVLSLLEYRSNLSTL